MKVIANAFKDKPELKKYMKKLMPFVQVAKVHICTGNMLGIPNMGFHV